MISLTAICLLIQANDVTFFCAIGFHFSKGRGKDNIIVGSKGTQEVCPIRPGRGQQDGSAATAVLPT